MQNRICLNSNTYHGFPLESAVSGASRADIRYMELSAVADWTPHVSVEMDDAEIRDILILLARHLIAPIALGGHSNLTSAEGRAHFRRNLDLGYRLGVEYVVTGTGETHGDESVIDDEAQFAAELRLLAADARERGLRIAIETHGAIYDTGERVARLVELVGADNVGVAYDTGNVVFYGATEPYDDLERVASLVTGFHLKEKAGAQSEWNFPAIGDGDLDFGRIGGILERTGNAAPLSIEIEFTPEGPGSVDIVHQAVARSAATIRRTMTTAG